MINCCPKWIHRFWWSTKQKTGITTSHQHRLKVDNDWSFQAKPSARSSCEVSWKALVDHGWSSVYTWPVLQPWWLGMVVWILFCCSIILGYAVADILVILNFIFISTCTFIWTILQINTHTNKLQTECRGSYDQNKCKFCRDSVQIWI
jgi:hypothetical protein